MARCGSETGTVDYKSEAGYPKTGNRAVSFWGKRRDCFQVYLIEVNSCPALSLCGHVLEKLLPAVIEEVFQKAVDPLFPGSATAQQETLQGFKPLQIQSLRARALTRLHSSPTTHDSAQPIPCDKNMIVLK
jgi:hypothetical protein